MTLLCVSFSTASCSSWWNRFPCFHLDTTLLISLSIFSYPFSMHSVAVWLHLPDNLLSGTGMRLLGALQAGSSQSWMNPLPLSSENMCSSFSLFWWPSADLSPYLWSYCDLFLPGSPKLDELSEATRNAKRSQSRKTFRELSTFLTEHFTSLFCRFLYEISDCTLRLW